VLLSPNRDGSTEKSGAGHGSLDGRGHSRLEAEGACGKGGTVVKTLGTCGSQGSALSGDSPPVVRASAVL